jgi:hypothetical protein
LAESRAKMAESHGLAPATIRTEKSYLFYKKGNQKVVGGII